MSTWSLTYQQSVFKRMPVTNIYQSFTYKMAAKINWHRYGTKLRHCHCHPIYCCCCCRHRVAYVLPLWATCWSSLNIKSTFIVDQQLRVWTEKVLQWYRKFTIVPVECQGSRASVPASVVPGHILGSWGQLCCPSNVCMPEDGYSDQISAELIVGLWHLSLMQSRADLVVHCGRHKLQPSETVVVTIHRVTVT